MKIKLEIVLSIVLLLQIKVHAQTVQELQANLEIDLQTCQSMRYTENQSVLLDMSTVEGLKIEVENKLVQLGEQHPQYYGFNFEFNSIKSDYNQLKYDYLVGDYAGDWYFDQANSYYSTGTDHLNNSQFGLAYIAFQNGLNCCLYAVDKWGTFQTLVVGGTTTIEGRLNILSASIQFYLP